MGSMLRFPRAAARARSHCDEPAQPPGVAVDRDDAASERTPGAAALAADVRIALQPIVAVSTGSLLAVEALARFAGRADTEAVFDAAYAGGYGAELEALCVRTALRRRADLPASVLLSVNVSPNALPHLAELGVWDDDLRNVLVEITERAVDAPVDLADHLDDLRSRGAAIGIDDVSTGYAGLLRLAQLAPDYVKVDRQVVTGVGGNAMQSAVLEALVTLSHRLGAAVIGEGVEDFGDLAALSQHDVDYAQGFAIGRPSARHPVVATEVVAACRSYRRRMLGGDGESTREVARTRDVYAVTAALASAGERHDLDVVMTAAADDLGVDVIGVSIVSATMRLREIASTGELDPTDYDLADYPATRAVLDGAGSLEIQLADPGADAAERALMQRLGYASMLLVPVVAGHRTIGVVEFAQRARRRWSTQDVAHARGLADHLEPVLRRLGVGTAHVGAVAG